MTMNRAYIYKMRRMVKGNLALRFFTLHFSLFICLLAVAQGNVETRWTDSQLRLRLALSEPKDAGRDYAVCQTPYVASQGGDTLRLEPYIFRGKRNNHYISRARYYGREPQATKQELALGDTAICETTINRSDAPWLWQPQAIYVGVDREREGCCNVEQLPQKRMGRTVYMPVFAPIMSNVEPDKGKAGQLAYDNPVLRPYTEYVKGDMSHREGSLFVHFPVDKSLLRRDFRGNAPTLDRIVSITQQIMEDTMSDVRVIQIIGQASFEGSQRRNIQLGRERCQALKRYVQQRVETPDSLYECLNAGEGWDDFRKAVVQDSSKWRQQLLDIIDGEADADRREQKIKKLDGGRAYQYALKNLMAEQRNSGYVRIFYDYRRDLVADDINRGIALVRQGSYEEGLQLLQKHSADSRSQSPMGVALYGLGRTDEAKQCFSRAAEAGIAEGQQNLRQIEAIEEAQAVLRSR